MKSRRVAAFGVFLLLASAAGAAERAAEISLIPWPASVEATGGSLVFDSQTQIVFAGDGRVRAVAQYFAELVERTRGLRPVIVQGSAQDAPKRAIVFTLSGNGAAGPEAYQLDVSPKNALISAADPRGLFNGAVTLWQLASPQSTAVAEVRIPAVRINDAPRLRWRGLLLDSSRQFQSVAFIKRYIDFMALHKLNVLHWHLVDDQAWRLQVPKYPKLTGGLDSYSAEDVREVVEHAASRNVMVVPGLEMPGHATPAIIAYPMLRAADAPTATGANLYNIDAETFAFFDAVFAQVASLFPAEYIHIGAGDVPKDQWQASARVQARMRELGLVNESRVQRYFFERIGELTQKYHRRIVGWDSIFGGGVPADSLIMTARGLDGALGAVASGHEVIVSSANQLSFNLPQLAEPNEGDKASDILSLGDVYRFDPSPAALSAQDRSRLIGVQANVWTRSGGNEEEIEAMTFPRAAALAEIGWTQASQLRWPDFQPRVAAMMGRYSRLGIRYSDAAFRAMAYKRGEAGGRVAIELAKQVPLGEIRYTVNGTEPTVRSTAYTDVFEVPRTAVIKAAVFYNGEPLSRTTSINISSDIAGGPM